MGAGLGNLDVVGVDLDLSICQAPHTINALANWQSLKHYNSFV